MPTYPNGNNGAALDTEKGRNERYAIANPNNCELTAITANGVQGTNWANVDAEHPEDRSIFPNQFAQFVQTGQLEVADGQGDTTMYTTQLPTMAYRELFNNFAHEYRQWVPAGVDPNPPPGSATADVADAHGSTSNPYVMSNLERGLNILKGRLYTLEGRPTSDNVWNPWMQTPNQANSEAALSALRAVSLRSII